MKRGAKTRNQETEAGNRYPSILRTSSTEKTVKLKCFLYFPPSMREMFLVFSNPRNTSPDQTDPDLKEADPEPPEQLLLSEQHYGLWGLSTVACSCSFVTEI